MNGINPMLQNNSIANYNKLFTKEIEQTNKSLEQNGQSAFSDFDNILNQKTQAMDTTPIINGNIQMNVGLENMGIQSLPPLEAPSKTEKTYTSPVEKTADTFGQAFSNGLNSVNDSQMEAQTAAETFAAGGDISVHEVMIASQKANLTMQMAIQTRNKLIAAYNEINNVRI